MSERSAPTQDPVTQHAKKKPINPSSCANEQEVGKQTNTKDKSFFTLTEVRNRGWTDQLIQRYLGKPDQVKGNPYYVSAAPMRLYEVQRVIEAEQSEDFRETQVARLARRVAARKAVETKKEKLAKYLEEIEIKVPKLPKEELIRQACKNYNEMSEGDSWASDNSDAAFLDRICVNYLRHCLTEYEAHLSAIAGKVGAGDAYLELKSKVLEAIADEYDWLWDECFQQEARMREQDEVMG